MGAPNKVHLSITFEKDGILVESRGGADTTVQKKAIPRGDDLAKELADTIIAYDPPAEPAKPAPSSPA